MRIRLRSICTAAGISAICLFAAVYAFATRPSTYAMYNDYLSAVIEQIAVSEHSTATVALLGDSQIARSKFETRLPSVVNYGVEGDTIDGVYLRTPRYRLTNIKKVVIEVGTNDYTTVGSSFEGIGKRYLRMLRALPPEAQVISIGILPSRHSAPWRHPFDKDRITANREIAAACAQHQGCTYLDVCDELAAPDGTLLAIYDSGDHRHISVAAYAVIWKRLQPYLNETSALRVR